MEQETASVPAQRVGGGTIQRAQRQGNYDGQGSLQVKPSLNAAILLLFTNRLGLSGVNSQVSGPRFSLPFPLLLSLSPSLIHVSFSNTPLYRKSLPPTALAGMLTQGQQPRTLPYPKS